MFEVTNIENCPRMCFDCPNIPRGVEAEVKSAITPGRQDLERHEILPVIDPVDMLLLGVKATAAAVGSGIVPGDKSEIIVNRHNKSADQVLDDIVKCEGPIVPSFKQRLSGKRTRCGALDVISVL